MAFAGNSYALHKPSTTFLGERVDAITGYNRFHSLSTANLAVKNHFPRIYAAANVVSVHPVSDRVPSCNEADLPMVDKIVNHGKEFHDRDVPDKLEEWIRGTIKEIVKNINQAPLLLRIYANGEVKTETAVKARSWPKVLSNTEKSSSPDGIILVQELGENRDEESGLEFKEEGRTRAFGVVIQGKIRGRDHCKSGCYLLKTSSVNGGGIGFICSHYCLTKVRSFTETASSQLKGCWLVE